MSKKIQSIAYYRNLWDLYTILTKGRPCNVYNEKQTKYWNLDILHTLHTQKSISYGLLL